MSGMLLEGDLFLKVLTGSSATTGFVKGGNVTMFELTPSVEQKERVSKQIGSYGTALDTVILGKPMKLKIGYDELADQRMLGMALLGTTAAIARPASSVPSEDFTVTVLDEWLPLGNDLISVNATTAITGKTLGVHYEVDTTLGMIKFLSGAEGGFAVNATGTITYSVLAKNGFKVSANTNTIIKCELILKGVNKATGKSVICRAWRVPFSSSKAFDLLGDDFISAESEGSLELPEGKTEPYLMELLD